MWSRSWPGPLFTAIALAAGIVLSPHLPASVDPRVGWPLALGLLLGALRARSALIARWALLGAVVAAGVGRGAPPPPAVPHGATVDDRGLDRVSGEVSGPVIHTIHGAGATLDTEAGPIWLWAPPGTPLAPGDLVEVTGRLRTPSAFHDPGLVPPPRDRLELAAQTLARRGEAGGLVAAAWRWADATAAAWTLTIEDAGGAPEARAALRGIVVGDRSAIPPELDDRWRTAGIFHVLSVSGLHLAVVAGLVFALLRRLIAASPWGGRARPACWAAPPALALACAYTLITGAQLATLRALVVIALVLIAAMLDRPLRLLDALGAAALVLLAWRPEDVLDPSFQLSFVAALTLAVRSGGAPSTGSRRARLVAWLLRGAVTSGWVALTTAPITAYQFHQITPGGVLGNLVLTPLVELIALPLALAGLACAQLPVLTFVGALAIRIATALVTAVDRATAWVGPALPVGHVAVASGVVMLVLLGLSLALAARGGSGPRVHVIGAWVALCVTWACARTPPPAGALRVTFLDVGQGDAAVVELPDGAVWLIDAGGIASARELTAGASTGAAITRVLAAYDHDRIDLAVLSHPHPDHYLGFAGLAVPIAELWSPDEPAHAAPLADDDPGRTTAQPRFEVIAAGLAARGTQLAHPPLGVARVQAGVTLEVWAPRLVSAPDEPPREAADPVRTVNDNSLVITLRYRGRTILLPGDVEHEGEDELVAAGLPAVDVVKVPHHGSPTSSSPALIARTRPELAVISCGRANAFGFPSPAVVARWQAAGAVVTRTDQDGAITVVIDAGGGLAVDRFLGDPP